MKVNRILVVFLLVIAASSISLWNVIQSDFVGQKLSRFLTLKVSEKLKADVSFKSLDIKLYPPGLELKNVSFRKNGETQIQLISKQVGVKFDLVKSMQRDLTLKDIYILEADIKIENKQQIKTKNKKVLDVRDISVKKILGELREKLPLEIDNISLRKTKIEYNEYKVIINEMVLSPNSESIHLALDAQGVTPKIFDFNIKKVQANIGIEDQVLKIKNFHLFTDRQQIQVNGEIKDYKNRKKTTAEVNYYVAGDLQYFNRYMKKIKLKNISSGAIEVSGKISGKLNEYTSSASLKMIDIKTPFVNAKNVDARVKISNKEIRIKKFKLKNNDETLELKKEFQFFNFETKTFVDEPIEVKVEKIKLKNTLKILEDSLSLLDGELSGDIRFILNKDSYHFYIDKKMRLKNISLNTEGTEILNIPLLYTDKSKFSIFKDKFEMEMDLYGEDTKLSIDGSIKFGESLKFTSRNAKISLKEIGKITGIKYSGDGLVDIDVLADKNRSYMNIEGRYSDFKLDEYYQKEVSTKINLDFDKSILTLSDLKLSAGRTKSEGFLEINLNNMDIDGRIAHRNIIYEEVLSSLNLEDLLEGKSVEGNWSADYVISGKLDPKKIILNGKIRGRNNLFLDESLDYVNADLSYQNEVIGLKNILVKKSKGYVKGNLEYSFLNSKSKFLVIPDKIALEELNAISKLPLGINGKISGEISGSYSDSLDMCFAQLQVIDTVIPGKKVGNSYLEFNLTGNVIGVDLRILGDKIKLKSMNFLDDQKFSTLSFSTKIDDINEIIGTNRLVDLENTNIKGELYSTGSLRYKLNKFSINQASINLLKFNLDKDIVKFTYSNPDVSEIKVIDGKIKRWSFYLRGQNVYFISKARGALDNTFNLETDFKIDASIFEIFNKVISKSSGPIYGKYKLSDLKNLSTQKLRLNADDLSLSTSGYPVRFEDISFMIDADERNITVKRLSSKIGAGTFNLIGGIDISKIVPKLNFEFKFSNAGINLFEKSNLSFSGQGRIEGESFPYSLKSDFYIERLNIVNEFKDLMTQSDILSDDIKYLPNSYVDNSQNLLDLDINLKMTNPASVKNSMSDLNYLGDMKITGNELNPVAVGSVYLAPGINKIFFKGNEYKIVKSNISFLESNMISNPEIDIEANSDIEDYSLKVKVTGPVKKFDLSLRTDPFLEENDILSLVAFGYTENTSSSLSEEQKNLMTQAGIGSLLFESFKINETLKKELGIQLNLGTEISNTNEDYLSQKSATGSSGQSVNSATKIEVKKEITSDIDLSVSSTVGSSSEQRQRMNLNYKVSDQVSLEGVYENTTNTETTTQGEDSSLGVDVRWKWTFK